MFDVSSLISVIFEWQSFSLSNFDTCECCLPIFPSDWISSFCFLISNKRQQPYFTHFVVVNVVDVELQILIKAWHFQYNIIMINALLISDLFKATKSELLKKDWIKCFPEFYKCNNLLKPRFLQFTQLISSSVLVLRTLFISYNCIQIFGVLQRSLFNDLFQIFVFIGLMFKVTF